MSASNTSQDAGSSESVGSSERFGASWPESQLLLVRRGATLSRSRPVLNASKPQGQRMASSTTGYKRESRQIGLVDSSTKRPSGHSAIVEDISATAHDSPPTILGQPTVIADHEQPEAQLPGLRHLQAGWKLGHQPSQLAS